MHRATSQANSGCSLQFSPTTSAVAFPKSRNIANRRSNGDWLDTLYLSDDLEVHAFPYATKPNARLTNSIWFRIELHNFCVARLKKNEADIFGESTIPFDAKATYERDKCRKFLQYIESRRLRFDQFDPHATGRAT
jgi:hypothetical protein